MRVGDPLAQCRRPVMFAAAYTSSPALDLKPVILHRNDPSGAA